MKNVSSSYQNQKLSAADETQSIRKIVLNEIVVANVFKQLQSRRRKPNKYFNIAFILHFLEAKLHFCANRSRRN